METSPTPHTPDALLEGVCQDMQTVLDSAPERTTVPVPRVWLQAWLTSLRTVLALRDAPLASGAVVLYVASGVMGILVGLAGGWLLC